MTIKNPTITNAVYFELEEAVELTKGDASRISGGWGWPSFKFSSFSYNLNSLLSKPSLSESVPLNKAVSLTNGVPLANAQPLRQTGFSLFGFRL